MKELLSSVDVRILEASGGDEFPGYSCVELAADVRLRSPGFKTIVIPNDPSGDRFARAIPDASFLDKTFLAESLAERVRELMESAS